MAEGLDSVRPSRYWKQRFTISGSEFTAVIAPINCNSLSLKIVGADPMRLRSDPVDPTTEDQLAGYGQEIVNSFVPVSSSDGLIVWWRFKKGDTIIWMQATNGDAEIVGTFVV